MLYFSHERKYTRKPTDLIESRERQWVNVQPYSLPCQNVISFVDLWYYFTDSERERGFLDSSPFFLLTCRHLNFLTKIFSVSNSLPAHLNSQFLTLFAPTKVLTWHPIESDSWYRLVDVILERNLTCFAQVSLNFCDFFLHTIFIAVFFRTRATRLVVVFL